MEKSVPGLQPNSLSSEELLKYARLHNTNGLPKDWAEVLLDHFERALDRAETAEELLYRREEEIGDLEEQIRTLQDDLK